MKEILEIQSLEDAIEVLDRITDDIDYIRFNVAEEVDESEELKKIKSYFEKYSDALRRRTERNYKQVLKKAA